MCTILTAVAPNALAIPAMDEDTQVDEIEGYMCSAIGTTHGEILIWHEPGQFLGYRKTRPHGTWPAGRFYLKRIHIWSISDNI